MRNEVAPWGCLVSVLFLVACAGPWAQPTHVTLTPLPDSKISGQADVIEATKCAPRCEASGGSDIIIIVDRPTPRVVYEATLAGGSCERPIGQHHIARFIGTDGGRAHVEVPVLQLTRGSYVIILRQMSGSRKPGSCGAIKR
jgi:hypothetical protein